MKIPFVAAALTAAALVVAPTAHASVTLGQVVASPDTAGGCGTGSFRQMLQTTSPPEDMSVPAGGGVITQWQSAARTTSASVGMSLMIWRATDEEGFYTLVGQSAAETVPQGTTGTFDTRIAVQTGDILGLNVTSADAPCFGPSTGDATVSFADHTIPSVPNGFRYQVGGTVGSQESLNVAATLEPDADGDGYGDETQDLCPTDASTHAACPVVADPTPTPTPDGGTTPPAPTPAPNAGNAAPAATPVPSPAKPAAAKLTAPSLKAAAGGKASGSFTATAAGKLSWKGRAGKTVVVSGSKTVAKGKSTIKLTLNAAGRKLAKKKGKLAVKLTFTFTAKGAKALTASRSVTFKR